MEVQITNQVDASTHNNGQRGDSPPLKAMEDVQDTIFVTTETINETPGREIPSVAVALCEVSKKLQSIEAKLTEGEKSSATMLTRMSKYDELLDFYMASLNNRFAIIEHKLEGLDLSYKEVIKLLQELKSSKASVGGELAAKNTAVNTESNTAKKKSSGDTKATASKRKKATRTLQRISPESGPTGEYAIYLLDSGGEGDEREINTMENAGGGGRGDTIQNSHDHFNIPQGPTSVENADDSELSLFGETEHSWYNRKNPDCPFTPLTEPRPKKLYSSEPVKRNKRVVKTGTYKTPETSPAVQKPNVACNKALIRTKFKPTPEMNLAAQDYEVAAYIFHPDTDNKEIIFKLFNIVATVEDFVCLVPDKVVNPNIVTYFAAKTTWTQVNDGPQTTWCLPPEFEEDRKGKMTVQEMMAKYSNDWLHPFVGLKYIYVPMGNNCGHMWLVVICVENREVHYFDSFYEDKELFWRRKIIGDMCELVSAILREKKFANMACYGKVEAEKWDLMQVQLPTKAGVKHDCLNAPVWVLSWMSMGSSFQPNILEYLNEDVVNMKAGVRLVGGPHNQCWTDLEPKVHAFWEKVRPDKG